ncbi:MAG: vitamin B12-dependent ribonucleotide reductase [Thermodesulfobacteriota bacterium]|nr:vitamin B12-dependent ribonucleotide reductase [Thermodesulfobacteriota bacterium]
MKGEMILVLRNGNLIPNSLKWDDREISDILSTMNQINGDQAKTITRSLRESLEKMGLNEIRLPLLEQIINGKMLEYGFTDASPIHLNQQLFTKKNGLNLSENAFMVLKKRYLKKDNNGNVTETPKKMFRRVAHHIAMAEKNYKGKNEIEKIEKKFYEMMTELKFLPNSPTLMNAGSELGQLAACFVLPVEDSMDGIFDSLKYAALIHKSGGGTGFAFSRIRAKDSRVGTTGGVASGPISFMRIFNTATEQVKQGGTRRGANMAILRVDHPDIMEFIYCKDDDRELNNFNISVALTKEFIDALNHGKTYPLIDPMSNKKMAELNAGEVYDSIVKQAWKNGDPGIIFLDRINKDNPTPEIGEIESTNPCGEQPLLPFEACNLGSIDLSKFIINDGGKTKINKNELGETVALSVRFLDNAIDMSNYPLDKIDELAKGNRKIGLGVMGFADMLYQMGVPYNSKKALSIAEDVMSFIQAQSRKVSAELAEERGVFKNFDKSIFKDSSPCRNATTTTIAPTGTLSIIAGCSSGIEPLFGLSFVRNVMDGDKLLEVNPHFEKIAQERGFLTKELIHNIAKEGTLKGMDEIPADVKKVFVTAHDISPEWHVKMQAAFQKYTENAVSKTVNLPHDATPNDVLNVYNLAYELGCKGVTIYRDGSKAKQVLSFDKKDDKDNFSKAMTDRPETVEGFTTKIKTGLGNLYLTVTECDGRPFEVFALIGKSGKSTAAKTEAIGRLVSLALRSGIKVDHIIEQLKGISGEHPLFQKDGLILSIPDAIAKALEKKYLKGNKSSKIEKSLAVEVCPECGEPINFEEGCMTCHFCGYTKCS